MSYWKVHRQISLQQCQRQVQQANPMNQMKVNSTVCSTILFVKHRRHHHHHQQQLHVTYFFQSYQTKVHVRAIHVWTMVYAKSTRPVPMDFHANVPHHLLAICVKTSTTVCLILVVTVERKHSSNIVSLELRILQTCRDNRTWKRKYSAELVKSLKQKKNDNFKFRYLFWEQVFFFDFKIHEFR